MAQQTGLSAALPHIVLPNDGLLLPRGATSLELEQRFVNEVDKSLTECAPGFSWNAEWQICAPDIGARTARCPYGFAMNIRLNQCRRVKYQVKPQRGTIKKWWDSVFHGNKGGSDGRVKATTPQPGSAADFATHTPPPRPPNRGNPDGWYGYGYNFGRHIPPW